MKKDKSFYSFLLIITFISIVIVSFIFVDKIIKIGNLYAPASVFIYPTTYFLATLFCEKCGKNKTFFLFTYTIFTLILVTILISSLSLLPITNQSLNITIDFKLMFALLSSFIAGHALNLAIYYYLDKKRNINFLISSIIAITFDSVIFIFLSYIGEKSIDNIFRLLTGQYSISVIIVFIYAMLYSYIIPSITKPKLNKANIDIIDNKKIIKPKAIKKTK